MKCVLATKGLKLFEREEREREGGREREGEWRDREREGERRESVLAFWLAYHFVTMAFLSRGMMWDCLRVRAVHASSKYSSVMANST